MRVRISPGALLHKGYIVFHLCKDTGAKSVSDDELDRICPVHRTSSCIETYVRADPDWENMRRDRDDAKLAADIAVRTLRKIDRDIIQSIRNITQPRESVMGTAAPLFTPEEE